MLNSGTIEASGIGGAGVRIAAGTTASATAAIANSGTIAGALDGVQLTAGGSVIDTGRGRIDGLGRDGILVSGGAGTITDAGTIGGAVDAIAFSGSFADRVILDPGAVLNGVVSGGSGTNTLELAAGPGTGTVTAFAGEFTGFGTISVDAGSRWVLSSSDTIGGGVTLTDAGSLSNAGQIGSTVTVLAHGSLHNTGAVADPAGTTRDDDGATAVDLSGTLVNSGGISGHYGMTGDGIPAAAGVIAQSGSTTTNTGRITGGHAALGSFYLETTGGTGFELLSGATLANSGLIAGGGGNYGKISGGIGGTGLAMQGGSVMTNTATITGGRSDGNQATGGAGIVLSSIGTVTNRGVVAGGAGGDHESGVGSTGITLAGGLLDIAGGIGVALQSAGTVRNSGAITGGSGGAALGGGPGPVGGAGGAGLTLRSSGTVINSGTIAGGPGGPGAFGNHSGGVGILLADGGTLINAVGASIVGTANVGIQVLGGPGTITDTGTITGTVSGGSGTNTLELAAGSIGGTGTVSFGTGFGSMVLDKGAHWLLDGAAPSGQSVTLAGGGQVLSLSDTAAFSHPIKGFASSVALELRDVASLPGATATLSGSSLTITSGQTSDTLILQGLSAATGFKVLDDGSGHALIAETTSRGSVVAGAGWRSTLAIDCDAAPMISHQATQQLMLESLHPTIARPAASFTARSDMPIGRAMISDHSASLINQSAIDGFHEKPGSHVPVRWHAF